MITPSVLKQMQTQSKHDKSNNHVKNEEIYSSSLKSQVYQADVYDTMDKAKQIINNEITFY